MQLSLVGSTGPDLPLCPALGVTLDCFSLGSGNSHGVPDQRMILGIVIIALFLWLLQEEQITRGEAKRWVARRSPAGSRRADWIAGGRQFGGRSNPRLPFSSAEKQWLSWG